MIFTLLRPINVFGWIAVILLSSYWIRPIQNKNYFLSSPIFMYFSAINIKILKILETKLFGMYSFGKEKVRAFLNE
jgi:hypothetical protein